MCGWSYPEAKNGIVDELRYRESENLIYLTMLFKNLCKNEKEHFQSERS